MPWQVVFNAYQGKRFTPDSAAATFAERGIPLKHLHPSIYLIGTWPPVLLA